MTTTSIPARPAARTDTETPTAAPHPRATTSLTGLWRLVRLVVRRDRVRLPLWIIGLTVLMVVSADQILSLYETPQQIRNYVDSVGDNPALVVFAGPGFGFDDPNLGVILVNETSSWMALAATLMSIFLVSRHTRAEEDDERADLVRASVVGRHAPITAALVVAVVANLVVAVASCIAIVALGFATAGSIALCASIGLVGISFAAVAACAAQIAPTGRSTLGLASGLAGVAFVVRGIGDVAWTPLAWLTPFGWGLGVRAYADERWWTLAGLAVFAVAATVAAYQLSVRRDLGSGIVAQRPGQPEAASWITHPLGLTIRLQRGALIGWTVALFVTGAVYGSIGEEIEKLVEDNPDLAEFLAALGDASLSDAYLARSLSMLAMLASGFAISSALRARSAETAGHAELLLTTPISRWRWAAAHLVVAVAGSTVIVAAAGLGAGVTYAGVTGDVSQVPRLIGAALVTLPAVLFLVGVAFVLFGWLPDATVAAWGVFAVIVAVGIFGAILGLPQWLLDLSPFEALPAMPAEGFSWMPVVVVSAVACGLVAAGLVGFRRRDLDS
jgi:ABC-2 type transport system permease protein